MPNQIERDAFVKRDALKNPIPYTRGTDLLPIVIHFRDFQIPSGATARVFVAKSDGNAVYTTATIDGNDVTVDVTEQMFIELGTALMQISIMDGDEELCTFVQPVNVEPNLKVGDFPASGNDITFLDDAIEQANQAVNTATTAAQKAAEAVQNANTAIANANKAISDLNEQIATLDSNFSSLAQTVSISQLQTVAKNLVGAVNELNSKWLSGNSENNIDYNNLKAGLHYCGTGCAHAPEDYCRVLCMYSSENPTNDSIQVAYPALSSKIYMRKYGNPGIWTEWTIFSDDATLTAFRSVNTNSEDSKTVSFNVIKQYGAALVISAYEIFAISWTSSGSPRSVYYEKLTNMQTYNLEITNASVSGSIMTLTFDKTPWSGVVVYQ